MDLLPLYHVFAVDKEQGAVLANLLAGESAGLPCPLQRLVFLGP